MNHRDVVSQELPSHGVLICVIVGLVLAALFSLYAMRRGCIGEISDEALRAMLMVVFLVPSLGICIYTIYSGQDNINAVQRSIERSYSVKLHGTNGMKNGEGYFSAEDKEGILLKDQRGKEHQCFFHVVHRSDSHVKYYVQCMDDGKGILTPGKPLSS